MIRERIVFGKNPHKIREELINQGKDLTLDKAVGIARTYELLRAQLKSMEPHSTEAVHSIGDSQPYTKRFSSTPSKERAQSCGKCGNFHAREACPAMGKTCRKCGKAKYFARMCKTGSKGRASASEEEMMLTIVVSYLYLSLNSRTFNIILFRHGIALRF
ncbi:uncharacterized protein [Montipora foliosa]|uniref:uncharacterized protein n=1 Tax=Montipora foliosa TaxID=591990 RepID=UPI0035F1DF94